MSTSIRQHGPAAASLAHEIGAERREEMALHRAPALQHVVERVRAIGQQIAHSLPGRRVAEQSGNPSRLVVGQQAVLVAERVPDVGHL